MSESNSSPSLVSLSQDKHEEEENRKSRNVSQETEFDIDSPDQALDSDDDFLPSPKPKKARKSVGKITLIKTGSNKVRTLTGSSKVRTNTIPIHASSVMECVQLPAARNPHPALCGTGKGKTDGIVDTSRPVREKCCLSKCAPPVMRGSGNIRPGKTRNSPVTIVGVAPVIRVGLSRRAPVKQLHKKNVT